MNITTIDITRYFKRHSEIFSESQEIGILNPASPDQDDSRWLEVTVFSDNSNDKNSITNSAKICQTIPYELLIQLSPTTKRIAI